MVIFIYLFIFYRKVDNEDILNKCFEFDWNSCKLTKFIKSDYDREAIKNILKTNYYHYKECYKYYASLQPIGLRKYFKEIYGQYNNFHLMKFAMIFKFWTKTF